MNRIFITLLLFVAVTISQAQNLISFNQKNIAYMGRIELV